MTLSIEGVIDYAAIHGSKHFPLISTHHSISFSDSIVCLLIVKGWKKVSFSTQDHNSKKFHRKKTGTITLLSVVHLQLITLSLRSCISSSHCIKATLRLNNIWVQTLFKHSSTTNSCFGKEQLSNFNFLLTASPEILVLWCKNITLHYFIV